MTIDNHLARHGSLGADVTILVHDLNDDECQRLAIGCNDLAVGCQAQTCRSSSRGEGDGLASCFSTQDAWLLGQGEYGFELRIAVHRLRIDKAFVEVELHLRSLGVNLHIDGLTFPSSPRP